MNTNERRINLTIPECRGMNLNTSTLIIDNCEQLRRYLRTFYDLREITLYNVTHEPFTLFKAIHECSNVRTLNLTITPTDEFLETPKFQLHELNIKSEQEIPYDKLFSIIKDLDLNILQIKNLHLSYETILNLTRKNLKHLYLTDVYISLADKQKYFELIEGISGLVLRVTQDKVYNGNFYEMMLEFLNDVKFYKKFKLQVLGVQLKNLKEYDFKKLSELHIHKKPTNS